MTSDPPVPSGSIEDLLEHAAWLRGLAGALVRRGGDADDLVQDTWIAAMRSPPPGGVPARAWLTGVARNVARLRFRGEARRADRERRAAGPAPEVPSAHELAERLELQRLLAGLVAELPDEERTLVLLRYYEGLTLAEISRRIGEPEGTTRWRCKQALDALRDRLDARHDGRRAAWIALFDPLARPGAVSTTGMAAVTTGGVLMGATAKIVTGCAVLALLAALTYREGPIDGASETRAAEAQSGPGTAAARTLRRETERRRERDEAAPSVQDDQSTAPSPRDPSLPAEANSHLTGRVVGADGSPLANADVVSEKPRAAVRTGTDGRFDLGVALDEDLAPVEVIACAPRHASLRVSTPLQRGATVPMADIVLRAGGSVSGRVLDETGAGVRDARVTFGTVMWLGGGPPSPRSRTPGVPTLPGAPPRPPTGGGIPSFAPEGAETRTAADGAFHLDGVPVGTRALAASGGGLRLGVGDPVDVREGEDTAGVTIFVRHTLPSDTVEGRVVAADGTAVGGVNVRVQFSSPRMSGTEEVTAGPDGRFAVDAIVGGVYEFQVYDERRGWTSPSVADLRGGARDVVLTAVRVPPSAPSTPAGWRVKQVTVPHEGPRVSGVVRDGGAPVGGALVQIQRATAEDVTVTTDGFAMTRDRTLGEARTDADGRYAVLLTERESSRLFVRATISGRPPAEAGPLDFDPERLETACDLSLTRGGTIDGRVLGASGAPRPGAVVAASRGDGPPLRTTTDASGGYRFAGVATGPWMVRVLDDAIGSGQSVSVYTRGAPRFDWSCTVTEGGTTRHDIDLGPSSRCIVRGRLLVSGLASTRWSVALGHPDFRQGDVTTVKPARVADDGAFEMSLAERGDYSLDIGGGETAFRFLVPVRLAPGVVTPSIALPLARLELRFAAGADAHARPIGLVYLAERDDGAVAMATVHPDAEGRFEPRIVLAGAGRIVRYDPTAGDDPRRWPKVAEFHVAEGDLASVELR